MPTATQPQAQTDPWAVTAESPLQQASPVVADPWAVTDEKPVAAASPDPSSTQTPSQPAGADGPLPGFPSEPKPDMKTPWYINPKPAPTAWDVVKQAAGGPALTAAKSLYSAGKTFAQGASTAADAQVQAMQPGASNPDQQRQIAAKNYMGLAKGIAGGGQIMLAIDAPDLIQIGSAALGGDKIAQIAMGKVAASFAAGAGAAAGAGPVADKFNLTPEAKELLQTTAFFLPSVAGSALTVAGFKGGVGVDAEGNAGAGVSSPGGTVRAGVRATPDAYQGRVQVGSTKFGVDIPRAQQPPSAAQISAGNTASAAADAVAQQEAVSKAASDMVNGVPPPPKGPPPPPGMDKGVLTPKVVQSMARVIASAPAEMQGQMALEAHQNLTKWIAKTGKFIGPDGKLQIADTPGKAATLAQTIINDEVDRQGEAIKQQQKDKEDAQAQQQEQQQNVEDAHDDVVKAQQKVAKEQEKQAQQAQKVAETPNDNGQTPAEVQYARAKTIIETSDSPQQASAKIMRTLNVPREQAHAFIAQHQQEQLQSQGNDVGNKAEPTLEESKATVDAQMDALQKGTIKAVMLPEGSKYRPTLPPNMKVLDVRGDVPGAGKYIYDPTQLRAATIKEAAKAGTHGDLLGHIETKEDLADGRQTVVVQAHKPDGTPIQDSQVHPENVEAQAAVLKERHPEAQISVKPVGQVLNERAEAAQKEVTSPEPTGSSVVANENSSERKGGRGESPEPEEAGGHGNAPAKSENPTSNPDNVRPQDRHKLIHVAPEKAPPEVQAWNKNEAEKLVSGKSDLKIESSTEEDLDPSKLKTTQAWASAHKLDNWNKAESSGGETPRIDVVRTSDGDYIVDGVHRASMAAREGRKVAATVHTLKSSTPDVEKQEIASVKKGDEVSFTDRNGKQRTGVVAHVGDRLTRIQTDGSNRYTVATSKVKSEGGDLGSTFYSNPLDPELFKRLIGEPLMEMAEPLRNALEHNAETAETANTIHNILQRLERTNKAATLRAKEIVRAIEEAGYSKADGDQVFAHLEDPSVKLTAQQEKLRDTWIKPLDQSAAFQRQAALLIKDGKFSLEDILAGKIPAEDLRRIAPQQENYQHRIPADKNTFVDKILGDSMKRFRARGASLSRSFSSEKRSVFQEIHGPDGEREAVAVKDGRVTRFRMGGNGKPETTDMGAYRSGFVETKELADEAAAPLERKLAALEKEHGILTGTKGRMAASSRRIANIEAEAASLKKQIDAIQQSIGGAPATMSDDQALAARLAPIQKVIDRLMSRKAALAATPENAKKIARLTERIQDNERSIEDIREQHEGPQLEGRYWRAKDDTLWKFARGTTKFISERTGQKYHANAILSSLVNYMETSKAMNAAVVMERMKGLLEENGMALKTDNAAQVPEGWKPTALLQMSGYYFPAHVADAFDQFAYLQSRGQPNILERANRFMIQSVLMNPLMHGKNIAANWFTGKATEAITGSAVNPKWHMRNVKAGIDAVNTMREMGGLEYQRLLRLGLDLQGASASFDRTTKELLRSFTDQLDKEKESNAIMSALIGVDNAAKWLQDKNHLATFGINDLFLLQSFYAAEAQFKAAGVPNPGEAARDWAHENVAEYTTPIRVGGSAAIGRLMENPNLSAFWRYHFGGIVRPVMNAVKEAAGSFKPDDAATEAGGGEDRDKYGQSRTRSRTNAIGRLAVMTLFAAVIFPKILDKLAKKITNDQQAKFPRGGTLGFASNVAETIGGDRTVASTLGSVATPALGTEEGLEVLMNRDFFTGKHVMGTNVGFKDNLKQLGSWIGGKSMPGQLTHRINDSKGKQALYSLLGFTFPMEHGLLEAAKIRNEAAGSNPADPKESRAWQSMVGAVEQTQRSNGENTQLAEGLIDSGLLTPNQQKELRRGMSETAIVFAATGLEHGEDVWRVYQHSTDEEKRQLLEDRGTRVRIYKYGEQQREAGDADTADAIDKDIDAAE